MYVLWCKFASLQSIFVGEDIRKQLPSESASFDVVNGKWKTIMSQLNANPNALRGTHEEGLLEELTAMNTKLEEIQRSLDMYLETKRQIFPRFYFLSNDDLLEILGQSRNPEAVSGRGVGGWVVVCGEVWGDVGGCHHCCVLSTCRSSLT